MTSVRSRSDRAPAAIVIVPPWLNAGSSNTFAAECMAHARAGREVMVLIGPTDRWHCSALIGFWRNAVEHLCFPGVSVVAHGRNLDPSFGLGVMSYLRWRAAGRDDALAISARHAAHSRLPPQALAFIRDHRIEVVHVNHCFEMELGARIARLVQDQHGEKPLVLLDTHDVQALSFHISGKPNQHSGRPDDLETLKATERRLCRGADVLTHCSPTDFAYFEAALPDKPHELLPPSLDPRTEARLKALRGVGGDLRFDFLYVGNNNQPNLKSVVWFLDEVAPRLTGEPRIAIVGKVCAMVRKQRPDLYRRHRSMLIGEVDSVPEYYLAAGAVIAPAIAGTGASIKLIEGLCAGKPIIATRHVARGVPTDLPLDGALDLHDTAEGFAEAMQVQLAGGLGRRQTAAVALYEETFSNERFQGRLNGIISRWSPARAA